jgi:spore maturation protein CgeB
MNFNKETRTILLVSEFGSDKQPYTYATSFAKIMTRMGYEVECFDCKKTLIPLSNESFHSMSFLLQKLNSFLVNLALKKRFKEFSPDIVFLLKAENISFRTLRFIKNYKSVKLMNFYPDSPFSFWNGNSNSDVVRSMYLYDRFAIWSKEFIPAIKSAGCKDVIYFPFAFDDEIFFSGAQITKSECSLYSDDLVFIGTWDPVREKRLTELVERIPDIDLAIWGGLWHEKLCPKSPLTRFVKGKTLSSGGMARAFKCSKIVLNFLRPQNVGYHNMRTFEVPASGAFMLTERSFEQAEELFKEGESVACFSGSDELAEKIKYFLKNKSEREKIAKASSKVAKNFTLERFIARMLAS